MRAWMRGLGISCVVGCLAWQGGAAQACGGCFSPPQTVTAVDSHRMVVALSPTQTTLWDQIRYSGSPSDFVWVLPVPSSDAKIELADESFFTGLDQLTSPVLVNRNPPPQLFCANASVGCGSSDSAGGAAADAGGGDSGVTIFNESVVGPYDTVTIGSQDAGALQAWLTANGYAMPPETVPTVMSYIAQKSVFIVLRLRPGAGVQAMQPVRVTYPGFMGTFPLKMVTVGAQGALGLTLWIFADQRYEARNYGTIAINPDELVWDWNARRSNYDAVFAATIERGGGRAWIAEFAAPAVGLSGSPDLDVAVHNLRAPYLTRLRTRALVEVLDQDIELTQAAVTSNIQRQLDVTHEVNRPPPAQCDSGGGSCRIGLGRRAGAALYPTLLLVGAVLVLRRRRRARRTS